MNLVFGTIEKAPEVALKSFRTQGPSTIFHSGLLAKVLTSLPAVFRYLKTASQSACSVGEVRVSVEHLPLVPLSSVTSQASGIGVTVWKALPTM